MGDPVIIRDCHCCLPLVTNAVKYESPTLVRWPPLPLCTRRAAMARVYPSIRGSRVMSLRVAHVYVDQNSGMSAVRSSPSPSHGSLGPRAPRCPTGRSNICAATRLCGVMAWDRSTWEDEDADPQIMARDYCIDSGNQGKVEY